MMPQDNTAMYVEYVDYAEPQEPLEPKLRRVVEQIEHIDRDIAHKKEERRQLVKEVYELTELLKKWCDETRHIAGPMEEQKPAKLTSEGPPWTSPE